MIFCVKLKQELEGLSSPPFPGELGQRIFNEVSQLAWGRWIQHQTMLINEYRLSTFDPKSRALLRTEMEKFLFSAEEVKPPEGYVPEGDNRIQ